MNHHSRQSSKDSHFKKLEQDQLNKKLFGRNTKYNIIKALTIYESLRFSDLLYVTRSNGTSLRKHLNDFLKNDMLVEEYHGEDKRGTTIVMYRLNEKHELIISVKDLIKRLVL